MSLTVQCVFVVLILTSAVLSYPAGRLGARYGNRRCVVLGTLTLIGAAFIGLIVPSYAWMFPIAMLAGTGFAFTNALTYPLLSRRQGRRLHRYPDGLRGCRGPRKCLEQWNSHRPLRVPQHVCLPGGDDGARHSVVTVD
jgi:MFS family permease